MRYIGCPGAAGRNAMLIDLGIVPGAPVTLQSIAPYGGPATVRAARQVITLWGSTRRSDFDRERAMMCDPLYSKV